MGGALYAHSMSGVSGVRHALEDHLRGSAALARRFGEVFGAGELAEYLALVHDVGKGACAWQDKLKAVEARGGKGRVGIPHKHAGTVLAERYTQLACAAVVFGHHGGLPDLECLRDELHKTRRGGSEAARVEEAIQAVERIVPEIHRPSKIHLPSWLLDLPKLDQRLGFDLLLRMLFSCVVDADYLDTSAHFEGTTVRVREPTVMAALVERFEARRSQYLVGRDPSPIDAVRQSVYKQACAAAAEEPGVYVLQVPTGGAKTMAAGGFALRHAAEHGKRRVIVAVPFISITEQNAAVYRDLLDPEVGSGEPAVVLEHHSAVDLEPEGAVLGSLTEEQRADLRQRARTAKLAAENWDAPFVVTTTVRLFESLFSHRPSQMRRLHNLAGSVVVLDEVQALPDRLLAPILSGLRGLVDHFGVTVLLASATQPSFWELSAWKGLERRAIVDSPAALFDRLRRVTYEWRTSQDVTLESIAREAATYPQVLTVVGTTRDAARFHRHLEAESAEGQVLHLSTRMTGAHRRVVIAEIRELLRRGDPVQVVSTSLIEAGVDVDFPRVYRAWAPPESLQQAAGRCNRDGRLSGLGIVVVFEPADGGSPRSAEYKAAVQAGEQFFGPGLAQPDDLGALHRYYQRRYAYQQGGDADLGLGSEIQDLRRALDFPKVDRAFEMIDNEYSVPVVVVRDESDREQIESAVAQLTDPFRPCGPEVLRGLQQHTASLPKQEAEAALRSGLAVPVTGDLLLWLGAYHDRRGLDPDETESPDAYGVV
ncbi:CRISPR-associated helicase/endonuclease Cas3 [Streptomyces spiralis]|uniref:CRISPR-associated helicase/endonuclease Cas3 n=1 Tax=Streptomyces spiralis TaxID=66376 RepID=A0A918ZZF0_9ACTN|nr:CRISPR-associated endonuclease Cas3'' [Streptomyces spiralis]GHE80376.1 CRISPR-associated helicase/endonuclease Cas3 [Streptomyces spiralis]